MFGTCGSVIGAGEPHADQSPRDQGEAVFDGGVTSPVSTDRRLSSEQDLLAAATDGRRVKSRFGRGPLWRNAVGDVYIVRPVLDCGPIRVVPAGVFDDLLYLRASQQQEIRDPRDRPSVADAATPAESGGARLGGGA